MLELAIASLVGLFLVLLVPLRAIPERHWRPLIHMVRSFRSGTPADFRPRRGLRALEPGVREELRIAVVGGLPGERLAPDGGDGRELVAALRRVGRARRDPGRRPTPHDAEIAVLPVRGRRLDGGPRREHAGCSPSGRRVQRPARARGPGRSSPGFRSTAGRERPASARPPPPAPPRGCASAELAARRREMRKRTGGLGVVAVRPA